MIVVGSEPRKAEATVGSEFGVFGCESEQLVIRRIHIQHRSWKSIDQVCCSGESIRPVGLWHAGLSQESEACLDYMAVLAL